MTEYSLHFSSGGSTTIREDSDIDALNCAEECLAEVGAGVVEVYRVGSLINGTEVIVDTLQYIGSRP